MLETLASVGRFILILFEVILIFNLMIVVHEYGHFLAARWRGLKIEKFQIWFGKAIIKKEINGVQWGLGTIPLGGFVALPQMAPMDAIEGKGDDGAIKKQLPKISPMDKIIVAFAGPLFSIGLAFLFSLLVWGLGKPQSASSAIPVIGYVAIDSPADKAGLKEGDRVLSIDGYEIKHFRSPLDSVIERVMFAKGETIAFVIERDGKEMKFDVGYEMKKMGSSRRAPVRWVGLDQTGPFVVGAVSEDSPAARAKLQIGDEIKAVDGKPILSFMHFSKFVEKSEGKPLQVSFEREGKPMTVEITPLEPTVDPPLPDDEEPGYRVGLGYLAESDLTLIKPGPKPTQQIGESMTMMFRTIGAIFSSKSDIGASHMSSAIGIGNIFYQMLSSPKYGWLMVIWFSVLLNVNLAILNMLPFPVLDGGHITIALMEIIRQRPVNVKLLEYVQFVCVLSLMGFMLYVTFFDFTDLFGGEKVDYKFTFPEVEEGATVPTPTPES